jgi:hypothetical protein
MGKSKKFNSNFIREEDDEAYDAYSADEYKNRKKEKRITTALRSKNVEELISLTNEEDDYDTY